jgi:hypothetical protein
LGVSDTLLVPSLFPHHGHPSYSQHAATVALGNALAHDSNAEWLVNGISLATLYSVLNKTRLPSDFVSVSDGNGTYVDATYEWLITIYDGTKLTHHLSLLVAIVASSLLPNLFMTKDYPKSLFSEAQTKEETRAVYDSLPWVSKQRKGLTEKSIFIAMITTYIVALYEPDSPLRKHMRSSAKSGLGNPWTSKHSMCCVQFALRFCWFNDFLTVTLVTP